jgi:hypothetical protein
MLPTKFRYIWPSGYREEEFLEITNNQKQELPVVAMFVNGRGVTIHFFHKRYVLRYLICIMIRITIRFIGNCLKSMLVDMGAAMSFIYIYIRLKIKPNSVRIRF